MMSLTDKLPAVVKKDLQQAYQGGIKMLSGLDQDLILGMPKGNEWVLIDPTRFEEVQDYIIKYRKKKVSEDINVKEVKEFLDDEEIDYIAVETNDEGIFIKED